MPRKLKKKNRGFTLVELMVVLVVVGILTLIAMPTYLRYQARTRTTEVKIYLSQVYMSEKIFKEQFSSYTSCLNNISFAPEGTQRFYGIGFTTSAARSSTCGQTGSLPCNGDLGTNATGCLNAGSTGSENGEGEIHFVKGLKKVNPEAADIREEDLGKTSISVDKFKVGAAARISSNKDLLDQWTVDEGKKIEQVTIGY